MPSSHGQPPAWGHAITSDVCWLTCSVASWVVYQIPLPPNGDSDVGVRVSA